MLDAPPKGAHPNTLLHLRRLLGGGISVLLKSAMADLPVDLRWLVESGTATIAQVAALHRSFGVLTIADLVVAVRRGAAAVMPGLDAGTEAALAGALPGMRTLEPRVPLGRALAIAEPILQRLRAVTGVEWALPVGSLRRGQDTVGDIEILASTPHGEPAVAAVAAGPGIERIRHRSPRRLYIQSESVQVGIRCSPSASAGAALLQLTGSPVHVDRLHRLALDRGLFLDLNGLYAPRDGRQVASHEEEVYEALGLPFIAPELRSGDDEFDAAREGRLPALVTRGDIRGDLHVHTDWSDGRDSTEAMVTAAIALGYEYVAITDHSPHSAATRHLSIEAVARQADEIAALRERYPQIQILHGVEVDILPDGRLDFSDRLLRGFDIVLASLHERAGHTNDELMRRYLDAMHHPLVTIITHPTNRPWWPRNDGRDLVVP